MGYLSTDKKKITTKTFAEMKQAGEKVTMLTAYDFTTAGIIDSAGIDSILIGDSASNVMAGNANTLPISVDEMIYHARSVTRAVNHALVVCDMPFGSYQISREEALRNACRMMKETGVDALKLEGGIEIIDTVKSLIDAGIPVHGHLGLTPQSVNKFGGYGIRAKEEAEAEKLISDAIALDKVACCHDNRLVVGSVADMDSASPHPVRLHGDKQWLRLLFAVEYLHHRISWCRIGNHSPLGKYHTRDAYPVGCSADGPLVWSAGTYFCRRSHHDGHHLAHSLADRGSALYRSEHLSWFCGRLHRALPRQLVVYGLN